jgi:hypothetical protein
MNSRRVGRFGDSEARQLGQLPFFIEYLKRAGLFDSWVAGCPIHLTSPNKPSKRDVLETVLRGYRASLATRIGFVNSQRRLVSIE